MTVRKKPLVLVFVLALVASACGGGETADTTEASPTTAAGTTPTNAAEGEGPDQIVVGHLSYHTGEFADVGPWFDCSTEFPLEQINESPPLGAEMVAVHQDIGTIGEAAAAQSLIEQENTNVLLNPAHNYLAYRDFMLGYQQENNGPLMPSVHGGAIDAEIGGAPEEPIFRGAPMDTAQAVAALLVARDEGAEAVALLATEVEGSQLQMDAAGPAADAIGLNVALELNVPPDQAQYRSEIQRVADSGADTLVVFSQAGTGGTIVKQAAEAGLSLRIIGTSEWLGEFFPEAATMDAINEHQSVWISGFSYVESPAWDYYQPLWDSEGCPDLAEASNSYSIQYYDLLNVTALAIEAAGSLDAKEWAGEMRNVAMAPGTECYSYMECIELLRSGEDIDYFGVTGEFDYTDTGVVSGAFAIFEWTDLETLEQVREVDGEEVLEFDQAAAEAG